MVATWYAFHLYVLDGLFSHPCHVLIGLCMPFMFYDVFSMRAEPELSTSLQVSGGPECPKSRCSPVLFDLFLKGYTNPSGVSKST